MKRKLNYTLFVNVGERPLAQEDFLEWVVARLAMFSEEQEALAVVARFEQLKHERDALVVDAGIDNKGELAEIQSTEVVANTPGIALLAFEDKVEINIIDSSPGEDTNGDPEVEAKRVVCRQCGKLLWEKGSDNTFSLPPGRGFSIPKCKVGNSIQCDPSFLDIALKAYRGILERYRLGTEGSIATVDEKFVLDESFMFSKGDIIKNDKDLTGFEELKTMVGTSAWADLYFAETVGKTDSFMELVDVCTVKLPVDIEPFVKKEVLEEEVPVEVIKAVTKKSRGVLLGPRTLAQRKNRMPALRAPNKDGEVKPTYSLIPDGFVLFGKKKESAGVTKPAEVNVEALGFPEGDSFSSDTTTASSDEDVANTSLSSAATSVDGSDSHTEAKVEDEVDILVDLESLTIVNALESTEANASLGLVESSNSVNAASTSSYQTNGVGPSTYAEAIEIADRKRPTDCSNALSFNILYSDVDESLDLGDMYALPEPISICVTPIVRNKRAPFVPRNLQQRKAGMGAYREPKGGEVARPSTCLIPADFSFSFSNGKGKVPAASVKVVEITADTAAPEVASIAPISSTSFTSPSLTPVSVKIVDIATNPAAPEIANDAPDDSVPPSSNAATTIVLPSIASSPSSPEISPVNQATTATTVSEGQDYAVTSAVNDLPRGLQRLRERKLRICGMATTKVAGVRRKKFKKRMTFTVRLWWMLQETSYRGPACLRFGRELNYFDDDMDIASPHLENFHLNSDTITSLKPKSSKRVRFAEELTTFIIPARGEEVLELFDVSPGPPHLDDLFEQAVPDLLQFKPLVVTVPSAKVLVREVKDVDIPVPMPQVEEELIIEPGQVMTGFLLVCLLFVIANIMQEDMRLHGLFLPEIWTPLGIMYR